MTGSFDIVNEAKWVFDTEIEALQKTKAALGEDFTTIVKLLLNCEGKVVLTGMGKPGHIATKMAATLASLGTPSFFMHPGEALHGDLGMVEKKDVVILMSYSGESDEVKTTPGRIASISVKVCREDSSVTRIYIKC